MENLPLKRDSRFHQGTYKPTNKDKFIGENAIFRSGYKYNHDKKDMQRLSNIKKFGRFS